MAMYIVSSIKYSKLFFLFLTTLVLFTLPVAQGQTRRAISYIESDHATDFGSPYEECPEGTFVAGFDLKIEAPLCDGIGIACDDTSVNGVRFDCTKGSLPPDKQIFSKQGKYGEWYQDVNCFGPTIGFEVRSGNYQGAGDDTAMNNLLMICKNGKRLYREREGSQWGSWRAKKLCLTGTVICGLQTQVEDPQGLEDDTSLNNIKAGCCPEYGQKEIESSAGSDSVGPYPEGTVGASSQKDGGQGDDGPMSKSSDTLADEPQPDGTKYVLSPEDLKALCKVVDPTAAAVQPKECVYMQWHFCPDAKADVPKPCGWYEQKKCKKKIKKVNRHG